MQQKFKHVVMMLQRWDSNTLDKDYQKDSGRTPKEDREVRATCGDRPLSRKDKCSDSVWSSKNHKKRLLVFLRGFFQHSFKAEQNTKIQSGRWSKTFQCLLVIVEIQVNLHFAVTSKVLRKASKDGMVTATLQEMKVSFSVYPLYMYGRDIDIYGNIRTERLSRSNDPRVIKEYIFSFIHVPVQYF